MRDGKKRTAAEKGDGALEQGGFQRLLVAVDLSPISDRVLARVALLPLAAGARITLLHVVPRSLPVDAQLVAKRDAAEALAEERRQLAQLLPRWARVDALVKVGDVAAQIASNARALKAELTVLGRGGSRVLRDVFLGSTAERVIRRAPQPVLAVRAPARSSYRRPAVALARDHTAASALALLLRVTAGQRLPLTVLHAVDSPLEQRAYPSLSREQAAVWRAQAERAAAQELEKLLAAARPAGAEHAPHWRTRVRSGSPRLVIEEAVKKLNTDLLVLGTHGYSGVAHLLLGTVAGDVLREVGCDVLLVPGPQQ